MRSVARCFELTADEEEAGDREEVREDVDEERQRLGEREEKAAERAPDQAGAVLACLVLRYGYAHLVRGNELGESASFGHREEDRTGHVEEEDEEDEREPHASGADCGGEARDRDRAAGLADEHHPPARQLVEQCTGRQREEQQRQQPDETGQSQLGRRVAAREYKKWNGDAGDARPELGERLADPEELEVAVVPQRNRCVLQRRLRSPKRGLPLTRRGGSAGWTSASGARKRSNAASVSSSSTDCSA